MRLLPVALLSLLAGCAGIFQRAAPERPATYAVKVDARTLRVGSAERDITPPVGGYLGGFDLARTGTAIGSPLKVRVLVLETDARRFAIVGVDSLGLMREDVDYIKSGMPGFANGDVFVCSSHTHAGPDPIGIWGWYFLTSGRDGRYIGRVRQAVREAALEARANAAPASLRQGVARLPERGLVRNSNRRFVFDRRVRVLTAVAVDDGRPLGSLLHFACHPEVLRRRNTLVSADFVGALCDEWRRRGHGQAVFVNGALGAMITPEFSPNDMIGVQRFGELTCEICERALADAVALPVDAIEVRRSDLYLPMVSAAFRLGRLTTALPRELYDGAARTSVGYLRIGAFEAVAVPGEMEPALAQQVRGELLRPELVVFGLCDDEVGYLMREQEAVHPEFAYERGMSPCKLAGEMVRRALTGR
ncbi:MAG: hypothetical protein KAI24_17235 [Planctomycetes bacterium]|nr:hypothetical protein [Planctomycetota bacterium]